MPLDYILSSKYMTRPVVRQRNSSALTKWSAYVTAEAIPPQPTDAWIRTRILAEMLPLNVDIYSTQTLAYFAQDPATQANLRKYVSEDNDDPTEDALAQECDAVVSAFSQRWADAVVNPQQVTDWKTKNGLPIISPSSQATSPPKM